MLTYFLPFANHMVCEQRKYSALERGLVQFESSGS
jgi:hypothetical protein